MDELTALEIMSTPDYMAFKYIGGFLQYARREGLTDNEVAARCVEAVRAMDERFGPAEVASRQGS